MKDELFQELVQSLREGGAFLEGNKSPLGFSPLRNLMQDPFGRNMVFLRRNLQPC